MSSTFCLHPNLILATLPSSFLNIYKSGRRKAASVHLVHFVFGVNVREIVTIISTGGPLLVRFPLVQLLELNETAPQIDEFFKAKS